MCHPIQCECGKITWEGCGDHIESVRVRVPADQWCPGHASQPEPAFTPAT